VLPEVEPYVADQVDPTENPPARPALTVRLGPVSLTGTGAVAALVCLVGLLAWLLVWMRPSGRMLLTGGLWFAFVVYWSAAAKNAAPAESGESPASRAVHTRLLNASLLLLFLPLPGLRGRFLPDGALIVACGLTLQLLGFALAAWARRHLGRNWSGAIAIAAGHDLVRSGPYRLVRHPIYSAMFAMFGGTAVVSGELHALLAITLLAIAYWRKIRLEERALGARFGAAYEDYRRATWALIPGLF
jgi:protein-S-isoprenylcysteine O-methyltransferase Ste14